LEVQEQKVTGRSSHWEEWITSLSGDGPRAR